MSSKYKFHNPDGTCFVTFAVVKWVDVFTRDFKKFTSSELIKAIKNNPYESRKGWMMDIFEAAGIKNPNNKFYQFWQQDNHPIELTTNKMIDQKLDYIHNNPVKQGFVKKAEDYPWSSMANYINEEGMIEIDNIALVIQKNKF